MALEVRDYVRDVPEHGRLVGLETAPAAFGGGGGMMPVPEGWAERFQEAVLRQSENPGRARRRVVLRWGAWFLLAVCLAGAAAGYVHERGVPLIKSSPTVAMEPLVVPSGPAGQRLRIPLSGPEQLTVGTSVAVEGSLPHERHGRLVQVRIRWDGGAWEGVHAAVAGDDGSFRVSYLLDRTGTAQVRILLPGGGFAFKWYRVS
jgi:hypothetical protein